MGEIVEVAHRPTAVAPGRDSLTAAEVRVVRLVMEGLTNPEIGARLFVSAQTVKTHMKNVFRKVGVSSRAELAAWAVRRGLG